VAITTMAVSSGIGARLTAAMIKISRLVRSIDPSPDSG
jgi:hypothetical protein